VKTVADTPGRLPTRRSRGPASSGWGATNRVHRATRLGFGIQRNLLQHLGHGHFQHDIEHGEQSEQEQIVVVVARERSQQFSEAGANQCTQHKVAGSVLTSANGRDDAALGASRAEFI